MPQGNLEHASGHRRIRLPAAMIMQQLTPFDNQFAGTWPGGILGYASSSMCLEVFAIYDNMFEGPMPETALGSGPLPELIVFNVCCNRFSGEWPASLLRKMPVMETFVIMSNSFSGSWPEQSGLHRAFLSLRTFGISLNKFTGTALSSELSGFLGANSLHTFAAFSNKFSGAIPGDSLRSMVELRVFYMFRNHFAGAFPAEDSGGLCRTPALQILEFMTNKLEGTLSTNALRCSTMLQELGLGSNMLTGLLLGNTTTSSVLPMPYLRFLELSDNRFEGSWPSALQQLTSVQILRVYMNWMAGSWPCEVIRDLISVSDFAIHRNRFAGTWPSEGFRKMASLQVLYIYLNRFAGTWPSESFRHQSVLTDFAIFSNRFAGWLRTDDFDQMQQLQNLAVADNDIRGVLTASRLLSLTHITLHDTLFEGAIPEDVAELRHMQLLRLGGTRIEGALPTSLAAMQPALCFVSLRELHLQGTVPKAFGRMSSSDASSLVLGHGFRGILPSIPGTLLALSTFRNQLQGRLPELRLSNASFLVMHSNYFSCSLPAYGNVTPFFAIALLGNHLAEPTHFPPWVSTLERGHFFTVSNRFMWSLLLKVTLGSFCLFGALTWHMKSASANGWSAALPFQRATISAQEAWRHSVSTHGCNSVAAVVVLSVYFPLHAQACTLLSQRLQMPLLFLQTHMHYIPEILLSFRILCNLTSFRISCIPPSRRAVGLKQRITRSLPIFVSVHGRLDIIAAPQTLPPSKAVSRSERRKWPVECLIWIFWLMLCFLISAPGATFSMLRAVPGLWHQSKVLLYLARHAVSLLTALLTSICLPWLAAKCQDAVREEELLSVAHQLSMPIIPCLVTFIFGESCLGLWVAVWEPCGAKASDTSSALTALEHVLLPYFRGSRRIAAAAAGSAAGEGGQGQDAFFYEVLLRRRNLCQGAGIIAPTRCMAAILDRSAWLLLEVLAHLTFTVTSIRALAERRMKLMQVWVHLAFIWQILVVLGPSGPFLFLPSVGTLLVYQWVLFGAPALLRCDVEAATALHAPRLPHHSLQAALCGAVLLQLSLVLLLGRREGLLLTVVGFLLGAAMGSQTPRAKTQ